MPAIRQPFTFWPLNDRNFYWGPIIAGIDEFEPDPTPIDDCVGTFTIFDPNGVAVPGANALPFMLTSNTSDPNTAPGVYLAQISGTLFNPPLSNGLPSYTTVIVLNSPSLQTGNNLWSVPTIIKLRNSP